MQGQNEARAAAVKLSRAISEHVGSSYGFPDGVKGEPEWFLTVYTDLETFTPPDLFDGYKVRKRSVPRAR